MSLPGGREPCEVTRLCCGATAELLERLVGLLAGVRLGVDGDGLGERLLGLRVVLVGRLGVALLLGDPRLVAQEDALVEPALLPVRVGLEHRVDLLERARDVAAVEERDGVVGADAGVGGLLLPGGGVDLGGGGEVRAALLEVLVLERRVALVVEVVGAGDQLAVAAAGVGADGLDRRGAGARRGVVAEPPPKPPETMTTMTMTTTARAPKPPQMTAGESRPGPPDEAPAAWSSAAPPPLGAAVAAAAAGLPLSASLTPARLAPHSGQNLASPASLPHSGQYMLGLPLE